MKVIGLTAYAASGKDLCFKLLDKYYPKKFRRFAFADSLKQDLRKFLFEKTEIDILTCTSGEKALVRPLMVAYGCLMRNIGNGLHWVKETERTMKDISSDELPVCTDFRFVNEVEYFRRYHDLFLVEIVRLSNGAPIPAPNEEEAFNQPLLKKYVDYTITWETTSDLDDLKPSIVSLCAAAHDKLI